MSVSDIAGLYQAGKPSASTGTSKSLGKDEFLTLFVAQLKAQDPLNPLDSTGFTAQMAQFSSLEQLTNINTGLQNMLAFQGSLQNMMSTDLIGKRVKVVGNGVQLNGQADLNFSLSGNAAKTGISIYDASGALVRRLDLGSQAAGNHAVQWDGRNANNTALPPGQYTFTVDAVDDKGQALTATTIMTGTVTGVGFENGRTYLSLNGTTKIQLGDILEIGGA